MQLAANLMVLRGPKRFCYADELNQLLEAFWNLINMNKLFGFGQTMLLATL